MLFRCVVLSLFLGIVQSAAPSVVIASAVTEIAPNFASTVGDQLVKIVAFGFDTKKATTVQIGVSSCDKVAWVSTTMLKCRLSAGIGGGLTVTVNDVSRAVLAKGFSYSAPTISYINPIRGSVTGYRLISIKGYDFGTVSGGQVAVVGQTSCLETTWIDQNTLECITPPAAAADTKGTIYVWIDNQVAWKSTVDYTYDLPSATEQGLETAVLSLSCFNITMSQIGKAAGQTVHWVTDNLEDVANLSKTKAVLLAAKMTATDVDSVLRARAYLLNVRDAFVASKRTCPVVAIAAGTGTTTTHVAAANTPAPPAPTPAPAASAPTPPPATSSLILSTTVTSTTAVRTLPPEVQMVREQEIAYEKKEAMQTDAPVSLATPAAVLPPQISNEPPPLPRHEYLFGPDGWGTLFIVFCQLLFVGCAFCFIAFPSGRYLAVLAVFLVGLGLFGTFAVAMNRFSARSLARAGEYRQLI